MPLVTPAPTSNVHRRIVDVAPDTAEAKAVPADNSSIAAQMIVRIFLPQTTMPAALALDFASTVKRRRWPLSQCRAAARPIAVADADWLE